MPLPVDVATRYPSPMPVRAATERFLARDEPLLAQAVEPAAGPELPDDAIAELVGLRHGRPIHHSPHTLALAAYAFADGMGATRAEVSSLFAVTSGLIEACVLYPPAAVIPVAIVEPGWNLDRVHMAVMACMFIEARGSPAAARLRRSPWVDGYDRRDALAYPPAIHREADAAAEAGADVWWRRTRGCSTVYRTGSRDAARTKAARLAHLDALMRSLAGGAEAPH